MWFWLTISVIATILFGSASAEAVVLQNISGQVVVNKGGGFETAKEKVGDQIVVAPDATATIAYGEGCSVAVLPEAVVEVAPKAPCLPGHTNPNGNS